MKEILVNSNSKEVRATVLDGGNVSEIFIERINQKSVVGNIYKGKVTKVLPGMQSAFVEVGLQRAAFLHIDDIYQENSDNIMFLDDDHDHMEAETEYQTPQKELAPIEEILTDEQEIIVQVAKDAIATKGARLTTHLTIPGRYVVLMPGYNHLGISRKIENENERERLRGILNDIKPEGFGLIARTVSEGVTKEDLKTDLDYLRGIWKKVSSSMETAAAPSLIYGDHDLILKILRDVTTKDVSRIIIDNKNDFDKICKFMKEHFINSDVAIELYTGEIPLFDQYNVEIEINRVLDKKVWLKSGGSIVIDQAEALTVIDVNTGKYVGGRNFSDTILTTNLEACKEIAHQLKIRNIGGIIIVDFIDMEHPEDRDKVLHSLEQYLKEDRAKTSVVNISPLGLVEITRKRVQENISRIIGEDCPYCEGRGVIKSKITVCYEIMRKITCIANEHKNKVITIEAHTDVADILLTHESEWVENIEKQYNLSIRIQPVNGATHEYYQINVREK